MAWPARATLRREAAMPLEALGLLHAHAGLDLHLLCAELVGLRLQQADGLSVARRAGQQQGRLRPLGTDRHRDRGLHRHIHAGDTARGQRHDQGVLLRHRGLVHLDLHRGVLLQTSRVHRGWDIALAFRDDAPELLRLDGHPALLLGHDLQGCRRAQRVAAALSGLGATLPPRPDLQARPLRLRHAPHGRGAAQLHAGHLGAGLRALHGRRALLQRSLPRRTAELSNAGRVDRRRNTGVCQGVRRRVQPRRVAEVRPLLHRGFGAQQLPEHHSGLLVVHGDHDLRWLRRDLPQNHTGEVCRLCGHVGRHGAHSLAGCHSGPEVPGHLRAARPRGGAAAGGHSPLRRQEGVVSDAGQRRAAPNAALAGQGLHARRVHGRARLELGGRLGAAGAAWPQPAVRVHSQARLWREGGALARRHARLRGRGVTGLSRHAAPRRATPGTGRGRP
mmetsp:Transcript_95771/g.298258  ORF Transcript_95771/g.298258 Transcript_95771/m.298258 type:complete len:447 (+) Transcript_95771:177-1517(+)